MPAHRSNSKGHSWPAVALLLAAVIVIGCGGNGGGGGNMTGSSGGSAGSTAGTTGSGTTAGATGGTTGGTTGGALGSLIAIQHSNDVSLYRVTATGLEVVWTRDVGVSNQSVLMTDTSVVLSDSVADSFRQLSPSTGAELQSFGSPDGQFYDLLELADGRVVSVADESLDVGFRVHSLDRSSSVATVIPNDDLLDCRFIQSDRNAVVLPDGRLLLRVIGGGVTRLMTFRILADSRVEFDSVVLGSGVNGNDTGEIAGLAVFADGNLALGDDDRDRISLYRLDGSLIAHTGLLEDCRSLAVGTDVFQSGDEILFAAVDDRRLRAFRWNGSSLTQVPNWGVDFTHTIYDMDCGR